MIFHGTRIITIQSITDVCGVCVFSYVCREFFSFKLVVLFFFPKDSTI